MVDKDLMRNRIIKAASNIFSKYGFKKTTMEEIAKAAGKGKSSIYYYYESKEQILEAVVIKEALMMRRLLSVAIARTEDPLEKLKNYVLVRMRTFQKLSNFYAAIFDEGLSHFDFIERIRQKYDQEEIETIGKIFEEGKQHNLFKQEDSNLVAIAIFRALKGLEIPLFWKHVNENVELTTKEFLTILFYGIVKR
jgi:AcrR family transcriptional regulator